MLVLRRRQACVSLYSKGIHKTGNAVRRALSRARLESSPSFSTNEFYNLEQASKPLGPWVLFHLSCLLSLLSRKLKCFGNTVKHQAPYKWNSFTEHLLCARGCEGIMQATNLNPIQILPPRNRRSVRANKPRLGWFYCKEEREVSILIGSKDLLPFLSPA